MRLGPLRQHVLRRVLGGVLGGVAGWATPGATALADQLVSEEWDGETGFQPVEELSYEAIVEPGDQYAARLRLRIAVRNSSQSARDFVYTLALPEAAEIEGLAIAREGQWEPSAPTHVDPSTGRRDPGTIFVRSLASVDSPGSTAAEVVGFSLPPLATVQIEVAAVVHPRLRGDRWELDLPARGIDCPQLADQRRVVVRGLAPDQAFYVDEEDNRGEPVLTSRPQDVVTVSWPAGIRRRSLLDGQYLVLPAGGAGEIRLHLQLGRSDPATPDHVVLVLDRSRSTTDRMERDTALVLETLLAGLPPTTTFDAIAFDRRVTPLIDAADGPASASDPSARARLTQALHDHPRGQGTDLAGALVGAAERIRGVGGSRALIVVITDGMFPSHTAPEDVATAFQRALGKTRPETLFVVDEPMLAPTGLPPDHPAVRVAARLGARISLASLSQLDTVSIPLLLESPRVLGDLDVHLPRNVELSDPVPSGLVGGTFVQLRGRFTGRAPGNLRITGRLGGRAISRTLKAATHAPHPGALVAVLGADPADAASEGFVRPPWYRDRLAKDAERAIAQARRPPSSVRGYLDEGVFRHYLTTRVLPRARACYNRALRKGVDQGGRVVLEMEVAKGEVMFATLRHAELEHDDTTLVDCLTEAAWSLDIPAGKLDQRIYRLRYPLRLIPPESGETGGRVERLSEEVMEELLGVAAPP